MLGVRRAVVARPTALVATDIGSVGRPRTVLDLQVVGRL